jgi:Acyl CoA:acetate/3-ketoacid CoA transferase, beta subunit
MTIQKRTREQIVEKVAQDIPTGSYVNLGIGLPTRVAGYLKPEQDIVLHSENGVLGFTALTDPDQADDDLINAGKELVSMLDGGSFMNSADSFDIMRGGHLDFCIMGAFQVAVMVISLTGIPVHWMQFQQWVVPWIWRLVLVVSMFAWNMSLKMANHEL